jgi:uncharacterized protein (DUF1697 family)
MPRYAALLRGVNVGKGNRVPMAELRVLLESLGGTDVRTLLNSGNAVFTSPARAPAPLAKQLRAALAARLGVDVPVVVVAGKEMAAIAAGNPLTAVATNPSRLLVAFPVEPGALDTLGPVRALVRAPERFAAGQHAAYLWCPKSSIASAAGAALLGKPGRAFTTRNWATVGKLLALLEEADPSRTSRA